jgi:hypothetical protein
VSLAINYGTVYRTALYRNWKRVLISNFELRGFSKDAEAKRRRHDVAGLVTVLWLVRFSSRLAACAVRREARASTIKPSPIPSFLGDSVRLGVLAWKAVNRVIAVINTPAVNKSFCCLYVELRPTRLIVFLWSLIERHGRWRDIQVAARMAPVTTSAQHRISQTNGREYWVGTCSPVRPSELLIPRKYQSRI